ncbi:conserved hypothetical protein [Burkholderia cenocepacia HI2424]|uniref:Uncharacterized protein n=2 Tax=Burkholderia cepacia complex TaxID=87882 RepID=A0A3R9BGL4_9BURK|nr:conserved hypothetical protein [Burkholderia cenocepacia HI2424]AQQ26885.1 hypothetical protein A8E88_15120 [Burkholderia cenocepacia]ONV83063.1 hypothetical protein A8E89_28720 [Burkholderia cenocepacia]ONV87568.1 hypothetical protein A8E89_21900 [Burkholderia cenocepacia]ONW13756.1 hypothetical protein A8E90_21495 [Burkholderia cenocepacia]
MHLSARSTRICIAPDQGPRRCRIGKNGRHWRECRCNGGDRNLTYYVIRRVKPAIKRAKEKIARQPFVAQKEAAKNRRPKPPYVQCGSRPATWSAVGRLRVSRFAIRSGDAGRG